MPCRRCRSLTLPLFLLSFCLLISPDPATARAERLALRHVSIPLPGAPSLVVPTDIDGDGRRDLAVVVAYTEWEQIGIEERSEMDGIDGLVEVLTIIPSLIDHRELRIFRHREDGAYEPLGDPLPLPTSVLSLEAGPPGMPLVALTDDGLSVLRYDPSPSLTFEPWLQDRPVLAGTEAFVPRLGMVQDLDGDGDDDLLFPAHDGAAIYLNGPSGLARVAVQRLALPTDETTYRPAPQRRYPLPMVQDVDGDGHPELLVRGRRSDWGRFYVLRSESGRFATPPGPLPRGEEEDEDDERSKRDDEPDVDVVYFGDLDGDGRAEYVTAESLEDPDAGMRKGLKEAKQPPYRYRLHRATADLRPAADPYLTFEAKGHTFGNGNSDVPIPGGFQDLDGDGRQDLIALTLDFSLFQAVRVMTTHRISIGMDFHLWCQGADGSFQPVPGIDLSGKFRFNLNNLRIGQLSLFSGDFDGDGRADFVQLGRGKRVTIHRGRPGCVYPPDPDATIELADEPLDLSLVQVTDLDGDERSDLLVIQPHKAPEPGVTPPVHLELYLSGGEG